MYMYFSCAIYKAGRLTDTTWDNKYFLVLLFGKKIGGVGWNS